MLWAVIMAGGSGTRFWPESRAHKPKQFLSLFGHKTLLEQTLDRLHPVIPKSRVLIVTHHSYVKQVRQLLRLPADQVIGEPVGRNTAPCAVLAAALLIKKDPEAVMALLPADHRIGKENIFRKALRAASQAAVESAMPVTFAMKADRPETGYGYLESGGTYKRVGGFPVLKLKQFHEKPSLARAEKFLRSRKFFWNSGMFVWKADRLLEAAWRHLPEAHEKATKITSGNVNRHLKKNYSSMPNISIDYGLMEKLSGKILTMPVDLDWHDVGSWLAFAELMPKDKAGNVALGQALLVDSSSNVVKSGKRLVALLGVKDLVVVDTDDALLICPKAACESIRKVVQELKEKKLTQYL